MKNNLLILYLLVIVSLVSSCQKVPVEANFSDIKNATITKYLMDHKNEFSSFIAILEKSGIDRTLSAYNPNGDGYTLFLPDNDAIQNYIDQSSQYSTLSDLLNDNDYTLTLSKYHVLNMAIESNNFPYGAFPQPTLTGDYLTVNVIIETDTSYYKINNSAPVIRQNIEVSNGFIHVVSKVLSPITLTTYQWIENNPDYSIFKHAIDLTGMKDRFNVNTREEGNSTLNYTLLLEADSIYNKKGIYSIDDLVELLSPNNRNYTDANNPLRHFVAYHAISGTYFLDDLQKDNTNYITLGFSPVSINGLGIDIKVNTGAETYDTIFAESGSYKLLNYIKMFYDESNIISLSGALHFIDHVMFPFNPSRAIKTYQFFEEPILNKYRQNPGSYLIEDKESLKRIKWTGADLTFVLSADVAEVAWNKDYLLIQGDFSITYRFPALIPGNYTAFININSNSRQNALIEVFINNEKLGGIIDPTSGGSSSNPYVKTKLGIVNFDKFEDQTITIKSLIPGRFIWDYLRFEPL